MNHQNILNDLIYFLPELVIAFGSLMVILLGLFNKSTALKRPFVATILTLVIAIICTLRTDVDQVEHFIFNYMFVISNFTITLKTMILLATLAIVGLVPDIADREKYLYSFEVLALMLLSVLGMVCFVSSANLITLYLSLELMSLPLYILACMRRNNLQSSEAALKYFILSALASCILLFGSSLIYGFTGHTNFESISDYFVTYAMIAQQDVVTVPVAFLLGMILIMIAFAFKLGAVPFHMWIPDVYQGAPTLVTAFFAAVPKIAVMGLFLNILYHIFIDYIEQWVQVITFLSIASMFVGAFGAIMQSNIKRLMGYSAIGHVGFMLIGVASGNAMGLKSILLYLIMYSAAVIGFFGCLMMVYKNDEAVEEIKQLSGMVHKHTVISGAIGALLLSMAGIPPFAGFFPKFFIFNAAIESENYLLIVAGALYSVISCYYYLYILKVIFCEPQPQKDKVDIYYVVGPIVVSTVATALITVYAMAPGVLLDLLDPAVLTIFGRFEIF